MTDIEQLKQQLYEKIQASSKPEEPLSDLERLKYSQLPAYQAHQRLKQQTEQGWNKAFIQGAIPNSSPFTPPDEVYLLEVLTECCSRLNSALATSERYPQLPDLKSAIADAITGIHEAAAIVVEPETYLE